MQSLSRVGGIRRSEPWTYRAPPKRWVLGKPWAGVEGRLNKAQHAEAPSRGNHDVSTVPPQGRTRVSDEVRGHQRIRFRPTACSPRLNRVPRNPESCFLHNKGRASWIKEREKRKTWTHKTKKRKLDFLNYTEQELSCDQQEANNPLRFLFAPLRLADRGPLCV